MGLNVDNLFIKAASREAILAALPQIFTEAKWKVAISNPMNGWTQLIDSHENTPPNVACRLSEVLSCRIACVQIYETAGEAGWHVFDSGLQIESINTDEPDDVFSAVREQVGPLTPLMFREVVRNPDWQIDQKRKEPNNRLQRMHAEP
jgi:hypothetical protein